MDTVIALSSIWGSEIDNLAEVVNVRLVRTPDPEPGLATSLETSSRAVNSLLTTVEVWIKWVLYLELLRCVKPLICGRYRENYLDRSVATHQCRIHAH